MNGHLTASNPFPSQDGKLGCAVHNFAPCRRLASPLTGVSFSPAAGWRLVSHRFPRHIPTPTGSTFSCNVATLQSPLSQAQCSSGTRQSRPLPARPVKIMESAGQLHAHALRRTASPDSPKFRQTHRRHPASLFPRSHQGHPKRPSSQKSGDRSTEAPPDATLLAGNAKPSRDYATDHRIANSTQTGSAKCLPRENRQLWTTMRATQPKAA